MSKELAYITPDVLRWGRETAGYTVEKVAGKIKAKSVTPATVEGWESGKSLPSYAQLREMSHIFRRPVAIFFAPSPPEEEKLESRFRGVPIQDVKKIPPDIRFVIRGAKVRQLDLEELHDTPPLPKISGWLDNTKPISEHIKNAQKISQDVREALGVSLEQQEKWKNVDIALKEWRAKIESLGLWVFKDPFTVRDSSTGDGQDYDGFCLPHEHFPVIYLNNGKPKNRQIFTLFHELGHLLLSKSGICFRADMERNLPKKFQDEENFCNTFAAKCLIPKEILSLDGNPNRNTYEGLAGKYKVSREVILRRYRDEKLIGWEEYQETMKAWRSEFENQKTSGESAGDGGSESKSGGDYYANQGIYLGKKFLNLVFSQYHQQRMTKYELAEYLRVGINTLPQLEAIIDKK